MHPAGEVRLFVAPRAGAAGKQGNSVGTYICADLSCSLSARGLRPLRLPQAEPVGTAERIDALRTRLAAFVARAVGADLEAGAR